MYSCPPRANKSIPDEYRKIAETLFPPGCTCQEGKGLSAEAASAFADVLGIGADYRKLLSELGGAHELAKFMGHFQNNLELLIQKTWVEKADEICKEKLQERIPVFIDCIQKGNYEKALEDFSHILGELAYLFFGAQSHKEDFTEYTFRIDTQMGLFWWYGGKLGSLKTPGISKEILKAVLLIGICYLTNF
jgi:hypothetical protein